ncbi:MAG: tetratricopeptide repeat protein [Verrucomicrobiales bacterium]|nr:tetratricopeptide repeat protein [Verrucomicrobiales bacterium]
MPQLTSGAMKTRFIAPSKGRVRSSGAAQNEMAVDRVAASTAMALADELARFCDARVEPAWKLELSQLQASAYRAISQGAYEEAIRLSKLAAEALGRAERAGDDTRLSRACHSNNHALLLKALDRYSEAREWLEKAISRLKSQCPDEVRITSELLANLSRVFSAEGQWESAWQAQAEALAHRAKSEEESEDLARFNFAYGLLSAQTLRHREAAAAFSRTIEILSNGANPRLVLDARICLASALMSLKEFHDAEAQLLTCLSESERSQRPLAGFQVVVWKMIAAIRIRTNRYDDAQCAYRAVLRVYSDSYMMDAIGMAEVHYNLGLVCFGRKDEATFKMHMRRAADLIDEQRALVHERDEKFRVAFDSRLHKAVSPLSPPEFGSLMMAPAQPTHAG